MQYSSPLHIIPNFSPDDFKIGGIKKFRKEVLLRFDLEGKTTIKIKGKEFDRNSILEQLESLQEEWPFHFQLFQNQPLLKFIEEGDLSFFKDENAWKDTKETAFGIWVEPFFQHRLSQVYFEAVRQKSPKSIQKLRTLKESKFHHPMAKAPVCYTKAFNYLDGLISEWERRFKNPFWGTKRRAIKPEIAPTVDSYLLSLFHVLPSPFEAIKGKYGAYLNQIIFTVFGQPYRLEQFKLWSLKILKKATFASAQILKNPVVVELDAEIAKFIAEEEDARAFKKKMNIGLAIFAVVLFSIVVYTESNARREHRETYHENFAVPFIKGNWYGHLQLKNGTDVIRVLNFESREKGSVEYLFFKKGTSDTLTCQSAVNFKFNQRNSSLYVQHVDSLLQCSNLIEGKEGLSQAKNHFMSNFKKGVGWEVLSPINLKKKEFRSDIMLPKEGTAYFGRMINQRVLKVEKPRYEGIPKATR